MPEQNEFSITDLARLTGLNVRTIRYWISQGLVPASGESGPGAHYGQGHLDRLRLIKRLQAEYLPNAEIRRRLGSLSDAEVARLLEDEPAESPHAATSALDYVRTVLGGSKPAVPAASAGPTPSAAPSKLRSMPLVYALPNTPAQGDEAELAAGLAEQIHADLQVPRDAEAEAYEPPPLERSQWERLSLGPNIELHVRRPLSRQEQKRVERLITIARQVLKEGKP